MVVRSKKLIVFIVPSRKSVNGGVMSIFSLCRESRKYTDTHGSDVVLCTYLGRPSYHKNDLFENDEYIYDFEEIMSRYPHLDTLVLNVPELVVNLLNEDLKKYADYISKIKDFKINILNQNILYMPPLEDIFRLYKYTPSISQTTAHNRYATQEVSNRFGLPLKHLSVFIDPAQYNKTAYEKKKDIIAYSPDIHPKKNAVINHLKSTLTDYEFVEIKDVTYSDYKQIARDAKFMITFGEGMDGYFIESTFSGSVPIAVYNDDYFPDESFAQLATVFSSYDLMLKDIANIILHYDDKEKYSELNTQIYKKLSSIYSYKQYTKNLESFYKGVFDFTPDYDDIRRGLTPFLRTLNNDFMELQGELSRTKSQLRSSSNQLEAVTNSRSWKLTKPFRYAGKLIRRLLK